jgi:L-rhamnose isomerase
VARELRESRRAGAAAADDAIDAGRELLEEFRDEVRRILLEAREELGGALEERLAGEQGAGPRRKRGRPHRAAALRFGRADEQ